MSVALHDLTTNRDTRSKHFESGQRHRAARLAPTLPPKRLVKLRGVDAVNPDAHASDLDCVAIDDLGGTGNTVDLPSEEYRSNNPEHGFSGRVAGQTRYARPVASNNYDALPLNSRLTLEVVDPTLDTGRAAGFECVLAT